jgi:hypothetical protein
MLPSGVGDWVAKALVRVAAAAFFTGMLAHAAFTQVRSLGREALIILGLARKPG